MITRNLKWVSSLDEKYVVQIEKLNNNLVNFYKKNDNYYGDIDFTKNYWTNPTELAYKAIISIAETSGSICEIGCGSSNILSECNIIESKYHGCDFSQDLMLKNQKKFPLATFRLVSDSKTIPFKDREFDFVFSIFVIEHVTEPHIFLNECYRILKPGGKLIILCPDFLGRGRMSSQRSGFRSGTTKDKLIKYNFFDALVTYYDNRIKIPLYCFYKRLETNKPRFLINLNPTVFVDKFLPDVDAVYVTYKKEIIRYLKGRFNAVENGVEIKKYEHRKKWIFMQLEKI